MAARMRLPQVHSWIFWRGFKCIWCSMHGLMIGPLCNRMILQLTCWRPWSCSIHSHFTVIATIKYCIGRNVTHIMWMFIYYCIIQFHCNVCTFSFLLPSSKENLEAQHIYHQAYHALYICIHEVMYINNKYTWIQ